MQHSPQEIKSRLDRAVDPEGNVLDMAAVLELVTTLERLPITREALEEQIINSKLEDFTVKEICDSFVCKITYTEQATRIGKTINLLRKKTSNEVLAKRAKKLVKKWQKLVINQIEATRNVESPLNGSRISSPQINGTLSETEKSSTPALTDRAVKSITINEYKKKGLKRKRSGSSSGNSPLNLAEASSQDGSGPATPSNETSDSKSLVPANGSTSKNEIIQYKEISLSSVVHKKPKLIEDRDKLFEKDGTSLTHTQELSTKETTGNSDNSIGKDVVLDVLDDKSIENSNNKEAQNSGCSSKMKYSVNNSDPDSDKANFSNVNDNACHNDSKINVNTGLIESRNHSTVKKENTNVEDTGMTKETVLDQVKNGTGVKFSETDTNSQKLNQVDDVTDRLLCGSGDSSKCSAMEKNNLDSVNSLSDKRLHSTEDIEESQTSELTMKPINEAQLTETSFKAFENLVDDTCALEPKELVLDLNEEANGINGRYNDEGTWYSWTDTMPYSEGALNILPYVILD